MLKTVLGEKQKIKNETIKGIHSLPLMMILSILLVLTVVLLMTPTVIATVEPGVTTNPCEHGFIDFEDGTDGAVIRSTIPGVKFTTTMGYDWIYGDKRTGKYNVYPYGHQGYECNGNFFAWLGVSGDQGRIDFIGGNATYLSVLTSTYSGLTIDAYDANGTLLNSSGWAGNNLNTRKFTRLTVYAPGMDYVIIHDRGNYWLIDDLCTDARGVRGVNLDISTDKIAYSPNETVNVTAKVTDAYGSCLHPLSKDNFSVYVDGTEVNIEDFEELSCTEYKLMIKAPQIVGNHTIGVNVDTAPGREYDSTVIKVYTIGNVYLTVEGNRLTQYENSADTPIYHRNDDGTFPVFNIEVEIIGVTPSEFFEVEDNIRVFVNVSDYTRVKDPVKTEANAFACGLGNSILYTAEWKSPDDFPVGKYNATAEVKDLNNNLLASSEKKYFYLIFKPPAGYENYISTDTSKYNQFAYQLWKPVLDELTGEINVEDAAKKLLLFAHGIDGSDYGYWHMLDDETRSYKEQHPKRGVDPTHTNGDYVAGDKPYWFDYDACSFPTKCAEPLCPTVISGLPKNAWWDNMIDFINSDFDPEGKADAKRPTGVCADYASLFISNARSAGIPAKEKNGILSACINWPPLIGHAWAEVFDGNKWTHCEPTWYQMKSFDDGIRILYGTPDVYTNDRGFGELILGHPGLPDGYRYKVKITIKFDSNDYDYGGWVNADITVKNIGNFDIKRDLHLKVLDKPTIARLGLTRLITDIHVGRLNLGKTKTYSIQYQLPDYGPLNDLYERIGDRYLVLQPYFKGKKITCFPCFDEKDADITFYEKKEKVPGLCLECNPKITVDSSTVILNSANSTSFNFNAITNESAETFVKPHNASVIVENKIKYYTTYTKENWYIFNPNNNTHDYSLITPLLGIGDAVYIPGYGSVTTNQSIDTSADYIVIYNSIDGTNGSVDIYAFSKNVNVKDVTLSNGVVKVTGMQNCTLASESGESYLTYLSTRNGSGMSFNEIYNNFAQEIVSNGDTLTQFFIEGEHEQISYYKVGNTMYVNTSISNNGILAETRELSLVITEPGIWSSENIIYNTTKIVTIPAKGKTEVTFQYQIPDNPQIGKHRIIVSDDITKATTIFMIQAPFNITFDVPATVAQAEEFYANATITNALDISLSGINVTMKLPNDFNTSESLTKNIGTLSGGESAGVSWKVNATDFEYGYAPITLYINSAEGVKDIATTSLTVLRLPELKIFPSAPSEAQINVSFEFKANVTNEGDLNLSSVSVNLSLPDNVTTNNLTKLIGDLAGGETKSVNWTITSMRENDFWIEVNSCDINDTYCAHATKRINIVRPEIELNITNPVEVILDNSFSVFAMVKNIGELKATQVKASITLPSEFTTTNPTIVNIGDLEPEQTKAIEWVLKGINPGYGEITVNITSPDIQNTSITRGIIVTSDSLSVETDKDTYMLGDDVTINITLTNDNPEVSYVDLVVNLTIQGPDLTDTYSTPIPYIGSLETENIAHIWDTTGKTSGIYTVTAEVLEDSMVLNETSTSFVLGVIDTIPPLVTNPTANPPSIVADGIQESQLNVTVTDESGIASVIVDLSDIGGSSAQEMNNIPGTDVYTVTTTAAVGTAPDTYELQVNATDIYGNSNTSVSIALTVTEAEEEDTIPPTIESVTLDAYTTIPDATIHVTVVATDNVGVTSVTADGIALTKTDGTWEGDITAPSTTGDYTLTIRAEDAAGNFAETTVGYSVVKPSGSIGIGVDPRLTTVNAGDTAFINIKLVSTENFDDVAYVYLTTEGVYPGYEANLTWFNWTSKYVKVPAGAVVNVPLEVDIPAGESGYKVFYAKLESTKWTPTAMDTGILYIVRG